ncbi:hypothetical protein BD410DRAFT_766012 [Rickenella mellea]|uniref:Zn(2)-C6 fungal-type domain-containing protein n=1 Tax=Rickenella mellea TaxID=50990 RepID=A0A4Y7QET9_9AGAM|nr:hypothetical protein BD410DRAFT_766012 [Rickenella mellea]
MSGSHQGIFGTGNIVDLADFGIHTDHRKRRRNRTTQSCLHCHTNKRKVRLGRPCQRCTQLGMTGLCIYEVEDPDARHDPDVAETTRLQNRIAELEILVRELRGKPHPRWTKALSERNMSEVWHSGRRSKTESSQKTHPFNNDSVPLLEIEPNFTVEHLDYLEDLRPLPSPMFGSFEQHSLLTWSYSNCDSQDCDTPTSQSFNSPRTEYVTLVASKLLISFTRAHVLGFRMDPLPSCSPSCLCLANRSIHASLDFLASQIQGTLNRLENFPVHSRHSQCPIYQKVIELNSILW